MEFLRLINWLGICLLAAGLAGCVAPSAERLAGSLARSIMNQDDPETVRDGAPAYLLLLDGLIEDRPNDAPLLQAAARLYGAYSGVFVEDNERARRLTSRARNYARRALCLSRAEVCHVETKPYDQFIAVLPGMTEKDVPALYSFGAAWAGWVKSRAGEWDALADAPKVEAILERVLALDETFAQGRAHLFLGIMRTQLSPALGGKPEQGRAHFERAFTLSQGRDLIARVELAKRYARMVFNHSLHDDLLQQVLASDVKAPGYVLSNTLAKREARRLLKTSRQYFQE